jgi:nucleoside-diphosphate-sugar epimerase
VSGVELHRLGAAGCRTSRTNRSRFTATGSRCAFGYVEDLIDGLVRLLAAPHDITGPINLGNPLVTTVGELAEQIIKMTSPRYKIGSLR